MSGLVASWRCGGRERSCGIVKGRRETVYARVTRKVTESASPRAATRRRAAEKLGHGFTVRGSWVMAKYADKHATWEAEVRNIWDDTLSTTASKGSPLYFEKPREVKFSLNSELEFRCKNLF